MTSLARRRILAWLGAASGALAAPRPSTGAARGYAFFEDRDLDFMRTAVDRLIPADEFPSASAAGVVEFIDGQLAGDYGRGARMYLAGPFRRGTPRQGYQLEFTPAALYRRSLDAITTHPQGRTFPTRSGDEQDEFLRALEAGQWSLADVPSSVFFETLLANTIEGYFADPVYGGNRDMAGWRMIGFPGAFTNYASWVGRHNVHFDRPPTSIAMTLAPDPGSAHPGELHAPHGGER